MWSMIRKYVLENKLVILGIILSPLAMYLFNIFVSFTFNLGTYFGTFARYLYSLVVC